MLKRDTAEAAGAVVLASTRQNLEQSIPRPHLIPNRLEEQLATNFSLPYIPANMAATSKPSNAIQAYFPPTPSATPSPTKPHRAINASASAPPTPAPVGDGFTPSEVQAALHHPSTWTPETEYAEVEIQDLIPGPRAVTFMGRVVGLMDVGNVQRGPRSAKGGLRLVVRDGGAGVTVCLSRPSGIAGRG